MVQRVRLQKALEIETKSGHVFRLEPSGDGFAIHPVAISAKPGRRGRAGRQPSPETLALRQRLEADAAQGALEPTGVYLEWLRAEHPGISDGAARQRIMNERKRVLANDPGLTVKKRAKPRQPARGSGPRGRKPKASTLALREKLEADAAAGALADVADDVQWLMAQDPGLKEATARQRVYKERQAIVKANPAVKPQRGTASKNVRRARQGGGRGGGRRASPALEPLRAKLRGDAEQGALDDTRTYVKFAMAHDEQMGLKAARAMVAREKRVAGKLQVA